MKKLICLLLCLVMAVSCAFADERLNFTFGMVYEMGSALNPLYCNQRDLVSINEMVFEGVMTLDDQLKPVCELALSVEPEYLYGANDEVIGTTGSYTVYLHEHIKFHDGSELCAQDVYETYMHIMALGDSCPYYTRCSYINRMEVLSEYQLKVTGKYNSYLTLYALTFPVLQRTTLTWDMPVGTGPYWYMHKDSQWMQIDCNPYWWKKAATVETITVFRYDETGDVLKALGSGDVDAVPTRSQMAALGRLLNDRISVDYTTLTYEMLIPNTRDERFSDVRTRQAIMYALDVSTIGRNIYMDMVTKSEVPVVTGSWLYEPQSTTYFHSLERAQQLLIEAGWGDYNEDGILDKVVDGVLVELSFTISTCVDDAAGTRTRAADLIADQLSVLGINVQVKKMSKTNLQKALKNRDFEMVLCGINLSVLPDLTFLLNSGGRMNYSGFSDTVTNQLLLDVYDAWNEDLFRSCYSKLQLRLVEELPFMGLFFRKGTLMTTADIAGGFDCVIEGDVLRGFEYVEFN